MNEKDKEIILSLIQNHGTLRYDQFKFYIYLPDEQLNLILMKLQAQKLIELIWPAMPKNRVYKITKQGKKYLCTNLDWNVVSFDRGKLRKN